jgi:hypothetical protein
LIATRAGAVKAIGVISSAQVRALPLIALLLPGCGLFGGSADGGDAAGVTDLAAPPPDIQPFDFAGAPDGSDLQLNPNRMDVTWRIFNADGSAYVNCDDPRLGADTILFVAVENANGATAKTSLPCPPGQDQGAGFIDLTNNSGQFTVTATAVGKVAQPTSMQIMPYYGDAISASIYLSPGDM